MDNELCNDQGCTLNQDFGLGKHLVSEHATFKDRGKVESRPPATGNEFWVDTNRCEFTMHLFRRNAEGRAQAFHVDDSPCDQTEFNLLGVFSHV